MFQQAEDGQWCSSAAGEGDFSEELIFTRKMFSRNVQGDFSL